MMFANNDGNIAHDNPVNVHDFRCTLCKKRTFNTGMNQHMRRCNNSNDIIQSSQPTTDNERENVIVDIEFAPLKFRWGEKDGNVVTTLKEETFAGRNFRDFAVFSQIRESLFPRNFSKDVIRESFFPRNFLKKSSSANVLKKNTLL